MRLHRGIYRLRFPELSGMEADKRLHKFLTEKYVNCCRCHRLNCSSGCQNLQLSSEDSGMTKVALRRSDRHGILFRLVVSRWQQSRISRGWKSLRCGYGVLQLRHIAPKINFDDLPDKLCNYGVVKLTKLWRNFFLIF